MTTIETLNCHACGGPVSFAPGEGGVRCEHCGATNYVSLAPGANNLQLVRVKVASIDLREEVERRLEVLARNLDAVDPAKRWPEGGPALDQSLVLGGAVVAVLGIAAVTVGSGSGTLIVGGGLATGLGAIIAAVPYRAHQRMLTAYREDAAVSTRNADLIRKLSRDARALTELHDELESRKEPR